MNEIALAPPNHKRKFHEIDNNTTNEETPSKKNTSFSNRIIENKLTVYRFYDKTGIRIDEFQTEDKYISFMQRYVEHMRNKENATIIQQIKPEHKDFFKKHIAAMRLVFEETGTDVLALMKDYFHPQTSSHLKSLYEFLLAIKKNNFSEIKTILTKNPNFHLSEKLESYLLDAFFYKTPKGLLCYLEYIKKQTGSKDISAIIANNQNLQFGFLKLLSNDETSLKEVLKKEKLLKLFQSSTKTSILKPESCVNLLIKSMSENCFESIVHGMLKTITTNEEKISFESLLINFVEKILEDAVSKQSNQIENDNNSTTNNTDTTNNEDDTSSTDNNDEISENNNKLSIKHKDFHTILIPFSKRQEINSFTFFELSEKQRTSFYNAVRSNLNLLLCNQLPSCDYEKVLDILIDFIKTHEEKTSPDDIFKHILKTLNGTGKNNTNSLWALLADSNNDNNKPPLINFLNYIQSQLGINLNDYIDDILYGLSQDTQYSWNNSENYSGLLSLHFKRDLNNKNKFIPIDIDSVLKTFSELIKFDINKNFVKIIDFWNQIKETSYFYNHTTLFIKRIQGLLELKIDITQHYKEIAAQWIVYKVPAHTTFSTEETNENPSNKKSKNFNINQFIQEISTLYNIITEDCKTCNAPDETLQNMLQITANKILLGLNSTSSLYSNTTLIHEIMNKFTEESNKQLISILEKFNIAIHTSKNNTTVFLKN